MTSIDEGHRRPDPEPLPSGGQPPVFCSIVDSAYFLGAVALVNSLRLTGHAGEIAFLDVGLTGEQRTLLEQAATIHEEARASGWTSVFIKPILGLLHPDRTVVLLDNDIVLTGSLDPLVEAAGRGEIAVFADTDPTRWFPEWQELFSLRQPLRRSRYASGSCVALSTARWHRLLERGYELGHSIAEARAKRPFLLHKREVDSDPVGFNEQDVLNALLMSEVPESAVRYWPHALTPNWAERREVRLVDAQSLRCEFAGNETLYLHFTGQPKPWQQNGWLRLRFHAFNRLLTRVLVGDDVTLRLRPEQLPAWLRPSVEGRVLELAGAAAARAAYGALAIVPSETRARLSAALRARLSGTHGRR
jgi:hypothetical protein